MNDDLKKILDKLQDGMGDMTDIIPGMGMMIHGLAAAVVESTMPPDGFSELKEKWEKENPDIPLTQDVVEKNFPEMKEKIEGKAHEVSELVKQCLGILKSSPKDITKQAIRLAKMTRAKAEGKATPDDANDFEGSDDEGVDAPLPGWSMNTKGNA